MAQINAAGNYLMLTEPLAQTFQPRCQITTYEATRLSVRAG